MRRLFLKLRKRLHLERDLDDEMNLHLAMGNREFGNRTRIREDTREFWTFPLFEKPGARPAPGVRCSGQEPEFQPGLPIHVEPGNRHQYCRIHTLRFADLPLAAGSGAKGTGSRGPAISGWGTANQTLLSGVRTPGKRSGNAGGFHCDLVHADNFRNTYTRQSYLRRNKDPIRH